MVKGSVVVKDPEKVVLQITLEASADHWQRVANELNTKWPMWEFAQAINRAIAASVGHIEPIQEVAGGNG